MARVPEDALLMRSDYDTWLIMRGIGEEIVMHAAIEYGVIEEYLVGGFEDYMISSYCIDNPWILNFIEEGRTQQRFYHTAEELFILAHEYDVREFGLKNMWPFPYIENRVRIGA